MTADLVADRVLGVVGRTRLESWTSVMSRPGEGRGVSVSGGAVMTGLTVTSFSRSVSSRRSRRLTGREMRGWGWDKSVTSD